MGSVVTLDNRTNQERSLVHLGGHNRPTQLPNHTSKRTLTTSLDERSWTRCPWLIWGHPGVSPFAGYTGDPFAGSSPLGSVSPSLVAKSPWP